MGCRFPDRGIEEPLSSSSQKERRSCESGRAPRSVVGSLSVNHIYVVLVHCVLWVDVFMSDFLKYFDIDDC
jgi:hypothetical protein